jgi:hypothetical protein
MVGVEITLTIFLLFYVIFILYKSINGLYFIYDGNRNAQYDDLS